MTTHSIPSKNDVLAVLSNIIDPDLKKDIVSLGFVKELSIDEAGVVSLNLELTTPACPVKETFRSDAQRWINTLAGVSDVRINFSAQQAPKQPSLRGLASVANIIAVSSCKGGVGKSTVAVNLAYSLAKLGAKVGIFDADVYGPSLPTMVQVSDSELYLEDDLLKPFIYDNVKLMSFGFVQHEEGQTAAMLRGPMVSQIINQLLTQTAWGDLDYLIIDMPPGTGDIQLTLGQLIPMTAAIIVTTPQYLSFIDVVKGLELFQTLQVPVVAAVENMSYFLCKNCDEKHLLFGEGAKAKLSKEFGFETMIEIPVQSSLAEAGDNGIPFILKNPDSPITALYRDLASTLAREVSKIKFGGYELPHVGYDQELGILIKYAKEEGFSVPPRDLRVTCMCAHCQEEFSGKRLLEETKVSASVYPLSMNPVGNYALGIHWSDGHSSLFPYTFLLKWKK